MEVAIAIADGLAACLFFTAAVIVGAAHYMARARTPLWAYTGLAFLLFALDRGSNMLEWGMGDTFAWMDSLQGYIAAAACLILVWLALQFWSLTKQVASSEEV